MQGCRLSTWVTLSSQSRKLSLADPEALQTSSLSLSQAVSPGEQRTQFLGRQLPPDPFASNRVFALLYFSYLFFLSSFFNTENLGLQFRVLQRLASTPPLCCICSPLSHRLEVDLPKVNETFSGTVPTTLFASLYKSTVPLNDKIVHSYYSKLKKRLSCSYYPKIAQLLLSVCPSYIFSLSVNF